MAAAHDDFFSGRDSEFDLVQHDDFLIDSVDNQQLQEQQQQQQQEQEQQQQREPMSNGLDFSPVQSPTPNEKKEDRALGSPMEAFPASGPAVGGDALWGPSSTGASPMGAPSSMGGHSPTGISPLGAPSPVSTPLGISQGSPVPLTAEEKARQAQQQLLQQQQRELQQQLQQEIDRRQREEDDLRAEQKQIAKEEIQAFYAQRAKNLERRKAQLKAQASAAAEKEQKDCGSGWVRVRWLVENSGNSNSSRTGVGATPPKEKERPELNRMRRMLAELAQETEA